MHTPSSQTTRDKIVQLEAAMLANPSALIHIEPKHYFAPGIYMREIFIPKGVTLTGKIHKTEHMCILSQGNVHVITETGIKNLKASSVVHSLPGTKRVLFAMEDSVWINVHHNPENLKDIEAIEDFYVVDTFAQYQLHTDSMKLLGQGK